MVVIVRMTLTALTVVVVMTLKVMIVRMALVVTGVATEGLTTMIGRVRGN